MNVCIYRMPAKLSIVTPGSFCPKCNHPIRWYQNIPVASYVILGGKCAYCKEGISPGYIVVEMLTALLLVGLYVAFGTTAKFFSYSVLTCCLIVVTFIDLATYEIPDEVTVGSLAAGVVFAAALPSLFDVSSRLESVAAAITGIVAGGGAIYIMGLVGGAIFKKEAMGGGDVKLMAAIGAFLGWKLVILSFFIAPFFGVIFGVIMKFKEKKDVIPYGPFLSLGAVIAIFFGDRILSVLFYGL